MKYLLSFALLICSVGLLPKIPLMETGKEPGKHQTVLSKSITPLR